MCGQDKIKNNTTLYGKQGTSTVTVKKGDKRGCQVDKKIGKEGTSTVKKGDKRGAKRGQGNWKRGTSTVKKGDKRGCQAWTRKLENKAKVPLKRGQEGLPSVDKKTGQEGTRRGQKGTRKGDKRGEINISNSNARQSATAKQ